MNQSLELLAKLAVRATGADGYAIEESSETFPPGSAVSFLLGANAGAPPQSQGWLSFVFRGKPVSGKTSGILKRFADLIDSVRRREQAIKTYAEQAARIGEMEAELIDAKIAARVSGLMADGARNGDAIGTVEDHLAVVLRPSEFGTKLEQRLRELEEEIAERKLAAQAKAVLQRAFSMSEEEAHLHLRTISRKSRRPLKEVARELIEAKNSLWLNQQ
jgi:AmiR/NasT family two-component response regulator